MIDRESHSLLNASQSTLPTEDYILSVDNQEEMEHIIDRLKRLRKLYIRDARLHRQIDKLYHAAIGHDFHLHRSGAYGETEEPTSKAIQLLDALICKAEGDGTFRGGKDPAELQALREEKRQEEDDPGIEKSDPGNQGDCFRWAGRKIRGMPDEARLVHGEVTLDSGKRGWHAWVEHAGRVHDLRQPEGVVKQVWEHKANPSHTKEYSFPESVGKLITHGHWGPWHGPEAEGAHNKYVSKADPGEEQGSFRGGDPEELQRKREEKRIEAEESGAAEEQDQQEQTEEEETDPAKQQEEEEKEEARQYKSMEMDNQPDSHGPGGRMLALEVSPVDTFGDYSPRNANGDPVWLTPRTQKYFPPGPIRRGENQNRNWSEVIGIKVPDVSPIQELRRYYAVGDPKGAAKASIMMPKSMIDEMINFTKADAPEPTGDVPPAGAEGRARGGKYIKRWFANGKWQYQYQDDPHPDDHGPGAINQPEGHTLEAHPSFVGTDPREAFNHSLLMHVAEGGSFPTKMWNDDTNQYEDKVLHFPGTPRDEGGNLALDPQTGLPEVKRGSILVRDPGQEKGGTRINGIDALHKKMQPVHTLFDPYGDPWVHWKHPGDRENQQPYVKYDPASQFNSPEQVEKTKKWHEGQGEKGDTVEKMLANLEREHKTHKFMKEESERGSVPPEQRKSAKDWPPTHHVVWDAGTMEPRKDASGNPLMAPMTTSNALERGDLGVWKWKKEDRGHDIIDPTTGDVSGYKVQPGTHIDFDSHVDRRKVITDVLHENYGPIFTQALNLLKSTGRLTGVTQHQKRNMLSELINHSVAEAFEKAIDTYNPNNPTGARLGTWLLHQVKTKMQGYLPHLEGVTDAERQNIDESRKAKARAARSGKPQEWQPVRGEELAAEEKRPPKAGAVPFEPAEAGFASPMAGDVAEREKQKKEAEKVYAETTGQVHRPRERKGRATSHGKEPGGIGLKIGTQKQLGPEEQLMQREKLEEASRRGELTPEQEHEFQTMEEEARQSRKMHKPARPQRKDIYEPRYGGIEGGPEAGFEEEEPRYSRERTYPTPEYITRRGAKKAIVEIADQVLQKAGEDPSEQPEQQPQEPNPVDATMNPQYLWREGEPGAYRYMWEQPNGNIVRQTNAPENHIHHDPEAGPPQLHPNEPTPDVAPHFFDKHGRKLHRPVPEGVESEHNDHYDPDVNSWIEKYQDPQSNEDDFVYLHRDRVKDHRLSFNEDLRHIDAQLEKVRQWYKQLMQTNDPVHRAIGLIFALLDQAKMVSDGDGSGLLSVRVGDVRQEGNTFIFAYQDAQKKPHQVQTVLDPAATMTLQQLMEGKSKNDLLFSVYGQPIQQAMLAKIFDDQFGLKLNQLRVFHGTEMFSREFQNLAATHPNLSPEDLPNLSNKAYGRVARMMGHTTMSPKLAQQMYVDPVAVESLYMSAIHHHHPDFNKSQSEGFKWPPDDPVAYHLGRMQWHQERANAHSEPMDHLHYLHSDAADKHAQALKMHRAGDPGASKASEAAKEASDRCVSGLAGWQKSQKIDERTKGDSIGVVGKMVFQGLPVSIENPAGSIRKWHDEHTGERGQTKMLYPYGFIRKTTGMDDGEVDVYIGPHRNSERVFVIHQMKGPTFKEYDEDKCMLGFRTPEEAKKAYLKHYDDPRFYGSMTEMSMREFKNKVFSTKKHPHMVTTDKLPGGKADGRPDTDFDPDALRDGTKVEMEHTGDPSIAYEITKDHLAESPRYYKELDKMEQRLKRIDKAISDYVRESQEAGL